MKARDEMQKYIIEINDEERNALRDVLGYVGRKGSLAGFRRRLEEGVRVEYKAAADGDGR